MKVIKKFVFVFVCVLLLFPISCANAEINFNQAEKIIKEVEVHLSLNQAGIAFNKLKSIEKMANKALSKNPHDEKAMFVLGIFYYFQTYIGELGWGHTAAESFAHSAGGGVFSKIQNPEIRKMVFDFYKRRSDIYKKRGNDEYAIATFERVVKIIPESTMKFQESLLSSGNNYLYAGNPKKASVYFKYLSNWIPSYKEVISELCLDFASKDTPKNKLILWRWVVSDFGIFPEQKDEFLENIADTFLTNLYDCEFRDNFKEILTFFPSQLRKETEKKVMSSFSSLPSVNFKNGEKENFKLTQGAHTDYFISFDPKKSRLYFKGKGKIFFMTRSGNVIELADFSTNGIPEDFIIFAVKDTELELTFSHE